MWSVVLWIVGFLGGVAGGFVTGLVVQRREMAHALGLWLCMLVPALYLVASGRMYPDRPLWYTVTGQVQQIASVLLGAWLRRKQRLLLAGGSEAAARARDGARLPLAILAALIVFTAASLVIGIPLAMVLNILTFKLLPDTIFPLCLPMTLFHINAIVLLPVLLAWGVFRWINGPIRKRDRRVPGRDLRPDEFED